MTPEEIAEQEAATAAAEAGEGKNNPPAPSQDPVKTELEKVQRKGEGKTELEKLLFSEQKIKERKAQILKEQGLEAPVDLDKNTPVTVGMLEQMQREQSQKTALQLADEIIDSNERELTKHYLQTRIVPSGNPQEDLRFARAAVNSVKNGLVVQELARKPQGSHSTSSGAPAHTPQGDFIPTEEEASYMRAPFNLSKEQILQARSRE